MTETLDITSEPVESPRQEAFLKEVAGLKLEFPVAEIAKKTGYSEPTVSQYLNSKNKVSSKFYASFLKAYGLADPLEGDNKGGTESTEKLVLTNKNFSASTGPKRSKNEIGVPVYDVEFSAGVGTSIMEMRDAAPVIARLSIPEVIGCDAIIRARGDSMSDFIEERDWIGIKQIHDWEVLLWDYPHAIVTSELELIKYITRGETSKEIVLVSHNKAYSDVTLPKSKILQLFLVKVVLPFSKVKTII